jgi:hypothetical protein
MHAVRLASGTLLCVLGVSALNGIGLTPQRHRERREREEVKTMKCERAHRSL